MCGVVPTLDWSLVTVDRILWTTPPHTTLCHIVVIYDHSLVYVRSSIVTCPYKNVSWRPIYDIYRFRVENGKLRLP